MNEFDDGIEQLKVALSVHADKLPIADYRQQILDSVDANQVTILTAETGAGKSTQVPQYLAEHGYKKVIVTQPRILAARNLSLRVREEWVERHGHKERHHVGYRTAHERDDTDENVILYCTDGLQLVREVAGEGAGDHQVLVLDEIHEWNQNMEVLIAWSKKRCQEDASFKVVVMSATIDAVSLAGYYNAPAPITVPGRSHPITMGRADDLLEEVERHLLLGGRNILVFLPGKSEIESIADRLAALAGSKDVPVLPLHSQLEAAEQQLAFASYPNGKVVLSTNIAQTSVTIDDIDTVIDSGLERRIEIHHGIEGLFIAQVSRADCLQRAGRAGRTKAGEYILAALDRMPCAFLEERPAYAIPEILRTHLDRLVLRLASVGIDIEELEFFHTPGIEAIQQAKQTLVTLGAMTVAGEVTEIGHKMERFPVESRYARMLVEVEDLPAAMKLKLAVIIAIQEVGGIIRGGTKYLGWLQYATHNKSDLLAHYDVYLALPQIDPEQYEDLGIVAKSVTKAAEVIERLAEDLGLPLTELYPIDKGEDALLMRCIVAGQIDQVWVMADERNVVSLLGGKKRELSGGTVVARSGIMTGTPFNLEVATPRGLETLHLVQDLTVVDPMWLESAAPHLFKATPGKVFFDPSQGGLARRWLIRCNGKTIKGASTPVTESTPQTRHLFVELCGAWLHGRLEEERRNVQKESGQRIQAVSLHKVQERVRGIAGGAVSLTELSMQQYTALNKLASLRSYMSDSFLARLKGSSKKSRRKSGPARQKRR
ncbi:MAG TPA: helicase-related protein [Verrucomicrobiae bacterium]|nr:helicase-related protein [Verrucomicrobiae bacterium]